MSLERSDLPLHYNDMATIIGLVRERTDIDLYYLDMALDMAQDHEAVIHNFVPQRIAEGVLRRISSLYVDRTIDPDTRIPQSRLMRQGNIYEPENTGTVTVSVVSSPKMLPRLAINTRMAYTRTDGMGMGVKDETTMLPLEPEDELEVTPEALSQVVHVVARSDWIEKPGLSRYDVCPPLPEDTAKPYQPSVWK